ncbi:MAG TPA: DUF1697 domain-containing protein [Chloroflexaceae bacterium]|nr:DUF1697 domain-containing protein [Chloroflexaceae bacterium]
MRYVALLGGINVGGHRVKMAELRASFEALGFAEVATFIASGNVLFASGHSDVPALEGQIERQLGQALGYRVPVFLRTLEELRAIAADEPFPDAAAGPGPHTLSVMFLAGPLPAAAQAALLASGTAMDEFRIRGREIYWLCRGKTSDSLVNWTLLGKSLPLPPMTVRNITTIRKLVAKHAATG